MVRTLTPTEEMHIHLFHSYFFSRFLQEKGKIFMSKYYCVRLHALFGAAMTAGLVSARMLAK